MSADVLFLGSSPNALVAAARLARAGRRVVVLETREALGGPVATETFAPGFRADAGVMGAAIEPEILRDLGASIEVLRRDAVTLLGKKPVTLRALPELPRAFHDAVELVAAVHRLSPPRVPAASGDDAAALAGVGERLRGLGPRAMHEVLRLTFMSIRDYVDENLTNEAEKTLLAAAAVRGLSEGPFAPGTLYPLLHRLAVDDALFRSSAKGGLGALARALGDAARAAGADVRTGVAAPLRIEIDGGVARGVRLGDGSLVEATDIVSDDDARATFTRHVAPRELDPEANRAVAATRCRGVTARVHLAFSALPAFEGVDASAWRGTFVIAESVAAIERAWDAGKRGRLSPRPVVEFTIPSVADPSLAPTDRHVLDASVQYAPHGRVDPAHVLEALLSALEPFDRGIRGRVLHQQVSLPEDLERRFGVTEGQLDGGEIRLDQTFFLRPFPGHARYASPVEHLWLGGSAAHPGGYSGRSGENLARTLASSEVPQSEVS